ITTFAPYRAKSSEVARPMPRLPPVTSATLPEKLNGFRPTLIVFIGFLDVVFLSVYFVGRKVTECGNWSPDDKVCLSVPLHEVGFNSSPKKLSSIYTNMRTSIVRHPVNLLNL